MKDILIGIIIGIGKIIPGVSGSVLAISLGVYERIINSINNIFKSYRNVCYLGKIGLGVIVSIAFLSKIIIFFLDKCYIYTIFIFIGLILGSIEDITNNTERKHWYLSLISFIVIVLLGIVNINTSSNGYHYLISGFIESTSSIIPGISGTALLMLIGTYNSVMEIFSNIYSISYIINNLSIIMPFIIGMLLGFIISIKVISFMFNKYKSNMYNIILGLLFGSIVIMLKSCTYTLVSFVISSILLLISYLCIKKVNHFF